jgi:hypothetical protein
VILCGKNTQFRESQKGSKNNKHISTRFYYVWPPTLKKIKFTSGAESGKEEEDTGE